MNKIFYLCIILLMAPGCAEWQAAKIAVGQYGSLASDETLATALWTVCNAVPVGAVKRRYNTEERASLWNEMCADEKEFRMIAE